MTWACSHQSHTWLWTAFCSRTNHKSERSCAREPWPTVVNVACNNIFVPLTPTLISARQSSGNSKKVYYILWCWCCYVAVWLYKVPTQGWEFDKRAQFINKVTKITTLSAHKSFLCKWTERRTVFLLVHSSSAISCLRDSAFQRCIVYGPAPSTNCSAAVPVLADIHSNSLLINRLHITWTVCKEEVLIQTHTH